MVEKCRLTIFYEMMAKKSIHERKKRDCPFGQPQKHLRIENIVMSILQHFVFFIYEYITEGNEFRFNMRNRIGINEPVKGNDQIVKGIFFRLSPQSSGDVVEQAIGVLHTVLGAVFEVNNDSFVLNTSVAVNIKRDSVIGDPELRSFGSGHGLCRNVDSGGNLNVVIADFPHEMVADLVFFKGAEISDQLKLGAVFIF